MKDLLTPGEWARMKAHHYDRKVEEMKAAQGIEDAPHEYDTDSHYVALRDANGRIIWRWGMDNQRLSTRPISLDVDGVVVWRSDQAKQESEG